MVNLPLFKLGALFLRHVSKYGANHIKAQAHEHQRFRVFAARYGQVIHQINMRLNVAVLRNPTAEKIARDKAETPTVKTKEQVEREAASHPHPPTVKEVPANVWRRKFKPLPEAKAVDLFADVIGDSFILSVAMALLLYEWWRSSSKPDANTVRLGEMREELDRMKAKEEELEQASETQQRRIQILEDALNKKWSILPSLSVTSSAPAPAVSPKA